MTNSSFNPFLIRSWLFVPAIKERFIQKLFELKGENKPDAVIFDLEDSVANTTEAKTAARNQLITSLLSEQECREKLFHSFAVGIRINSHFSSFVKKDIEAVKIINPHFIILPKVAHESQIYFYQQKFSKNSLCITIETIEGYENRGAITRSLRSFDFLAIGNEDLAFELGMEKPTPIDQPSPLTHIITSCLISAKKYNATIIHGPSRKYGTAKSLKDLRNECTLSLQLGFQSKVAIHPTQVQIINNIFNKEKLKKKAQKIIQKFQSLQDGTSVVSEGNEMMDTPSFNFYSKTLKQLQ